ncbi:MAG TPA: Tm-1-like ATP-binding domain-containing protein [Thermodesulfobacteriota bacterium]|nr:Tm-1-like ATP-binding domain-containing protein [Thermodesulfobacteriota bacterium]
MNGGDSKSILIVATLDTKGDEVTYLKSLIEEGGHKVLVMDTGILGLPPCQPDISREEVAHSVGISIGELIRLRDKGKAIQVMAEGSKNLVQQLYKGGKIEGIIGLGGAQGTEIGTAAMRALPLGFPKLMVSTVASGYAQFGTYVGTKDLLMMHSVVDILGLNVFSRTIFSNAAGAMMGMVERETKIDKPEKNQIGMTIYGTTTPGCMVAKAYLELKGFEVVAFHPNGTGGRAMEEMVEEGILNGVLDMTTHELTDELVGGLHRAGPNRLEAAGRKGIPQVVVPGSIDFIVTGPASSLQPEYRNRKYIAHNPSITLVRTSSEEMKTIGKIMASKLNEARGLTIVMIPLRGFSYPNRKGEALYDEEGNQVFIKTLKRNLKGVKVIEVDAHINDPQFANAAAQTMEELLLK